MTDPAANDLYLLDACESADATTALDYGCGDGVMVAEGVRRGYDFWGVEKYYEGRHDFRAKSEERTPWRARGRIKLIDAQNRIPFDDETFDFVCSNQVLEHVEDLGSTVAELARVTKIGGTGVHVFPTLERIVEPHVGVPFYHRVPRRARRAWARPWYTARVAYRLHPDHETFAGWQRSLGGFFEESVYLRRARTIEAAFRERFDVAYAEPQKLSFHTGRSIPAMKVLTLLERRRVGATLHVRRLA
jgi:SAM-dependent methyltransferase